MIGSLRGRLLDRAVTGEILVEVGGLGYRVQAGPATAARLGDLDAETSLLGAMLLHESRMRRRRARRPRARGDLESA